jgi:response regulator NasT
MAPDVIIIDTDSPSRDTLEHVELLSEQDPRPIVMFSADRDGDTIRAATRAGVSAYVVDGLSATRVEPIIAAAVARFDAFQAMKHELAQTHTRLSERKLVERAKGVLMKARGISEDEAYAVLRRTAMERSITNAEIRPSNQCTAPGTGAAGAGSVARLPGRLCLPGLATGRAACCASASSNVTASECERRSNAVRSHTFQEIMKRCTVELSNTSPGRKTVDGNPGWLGESG